MFSNCYKYNPPDHDVVGMARKLQVMITSYIHNKHYMYYMTRAILTYEGAQEKMQKWLCIVYVSVSSCVYMTK